MVWIEISARCLQQPFAEVTTLRVVWIEIDERDKTDIRDSVTTLRVVWIEIICFPETVLCAVCHHLAGGVD